MSEVLELLKDEKKYRALHQFDSIKQTLSQEYEAIGKGHAAESIRQCSRVVLEHQCDKHVDQKKTSIQYCKNRYCPTCTVHRSHLIGQELHQAIDWLHLHSVRHENWIFLTLTIRNGDGDGLSGQIDAMMQSWQRFSQRQAFRSVVKGWFRALEVTYNESERTFHPHFHVLINVPPSYFSGKYYLSQAMWMRLWRESLGVSYDPVVDVRRVRSSRANTKNALTRAILEVCKYPMKMSDLNSIMRHKAFVSFEKALFKRRLIAFGGNLKESLQHIRSVHVSKDKMTSCEVCGSNLHPHVYVWSEETRRYQNYS